MTTNLRWQRRSFSFARCSYRCARCPFETPTDVQGAARMARHIEDHVRGRLPAGAR
jgi:hypothetical protein